MYKEGDTMLSPQAREEVRKLLQTEMKVVEIAEKVGTTPMTVYNIRKELRETNQEPHAQAKANGEPQTPEPLKPDVEMAIIVSKAAKTSVEARFNKLMSDLDTMANWMQQIRNEAETLRNDIKADDETKRKIAEAARILNELAV